MNDQVRKLESWEQEEKDRSYFESQESRRTRLSIDLETVVARLKNQGSWEDFSEFVARTRQAIQRLESEINDMILEEFECIRDGSHPVTDPMGSPWIRDSSEE